MLLHDFSMRYLTPEDTRIRSNRISEKTSSFKCWQPCISKVIMDNTVIHWNEKVGSFQGWMPQKLLIISKNCSNKNCAKLNFIQKSHWSFSHLADFLRIVCSWLKTKHEKSVSWSNMKEHKKPLHTLCVWHIFMLWMCFTAYSRVVCSWLCTYITCFTERSSFNFEVARILYKNFFFFFAVKLYSKEGSMHNFSKLENWDTR